VTKAEQIAEQRRNECKNAREDLNAESKFLIRLRSELSAAKMELLSFMSQVKSIKGDISRADDLVLKEHASHHNNDSERQFIETDIAAFHDKISRLSLTSNASGCEIVHLGQEIDDADEQREVLQRNYRNIMNKKDIASALLVANEFEHRKVARTIESTTGEIRAAMSRFHQLEEALETTKAKTNKLLDEKERAQELIESQGKQNEILVALENDLENQLYKNAALSVEIGRPMNLHRWRFLRDKAPQQFSMLESIHNHQRQAIDLSQRIANQTCTLERSKVEFSKLRKTVSCHQSVDDLQSRLSGLKSELNALNTGMKLLEKQLKERIDQAADLNSDIVSLEQKSMDLKAKYIVSVVSGRRTCSSASPKRHEILETKS
jgi:predicted  nucleic acid-binding Zn-ribbon protein